MDLLLALGGFLALLMAMVMLTGERRLCTATPWMWLCLFGIFYGIHRWLLLVLASFPTEDNLRLAALVAAVLAEVSLLEFGRTGSDLSGRRRLPQWTLVPFALLAALGERWGEEGFYRTLQLALAMPAGFWAGWTLWKAGQKGGELGPALAPWAASAMAVFGLASGLRGVFPSVSSFLALRTAPQSHLALLVLLGLEGAALAIMVVVVWRHAFAARSRAGGEAPVSQMQGALLLGLLLVVTVGSVTTDLAGRLMGKEQRQRLLDKTQIVAATLDPLEVALLAQSLDDPTNSYYQGLRRQCMGLLKISERPCYIYLMGKKENRIVFYLDTEPERPARVLSPADRPTAEPGEVYDDAPPGLQAVFGTGTPLTVGPYTDKWGTHMSGFWPVHRPGTSQILYVVGYDLDASDWNSVVAQARLTPIAITLLLAGLLSMFVIVRERDEAARGRLVGALRDKQAVLDAASEVAIIATTPQGLITMFNRGAEKMLGYEAAELVGQQTALLFHVPAEIGARAQELSRESQREVAGYEVLVAVPLQKGAEQREWTFVRKDGTLFPVSLAMTTTRGLSGTVTGFLGVAVDLTARKRAEQELSEKERFISAVAQTSPDLLVVFDAGLGQPVYANRQLASLLGFSRQEAAQLEQDWLNRLIHPADQARVRAHIQRIQQARDGEVKSIEYRVQARNGTYRWFQSRGTVFRRDAGGKVIQFLSVTQDVTEMKETEESKTQLESQLRQSQKLEAVGQLAAGVAHDFNNLLTVIQGNAALLEETATDEAALYSHQILAAAHKAAGLTRQLLLFSRQHLPQRQPLNLGEVIPTLSEMLGRLIGENIRLQWRCDAGLPPVFADPGMIEQLVLNLAVNARDAMPKGGNLTLSVEAVSLDAAAVAQHPKGRPGRFICLSVADTGCGIAPDLLPRIFEPFFTTKEVGKGTGLGLATAYGIVEQHQGWIEVNSRVNEGTAFRIYLPISIGGKAPPPEPVAPPVRRGRGETILLVEDEMAVREFAERVLRRGGYQVLVASTGVEALELWPRHKEQIELLITDQLMPEGMTGHQLATQLRSEKPGLRVVLTSGYCAEAADIMASNEALGEFIAKPYTPLHLLQTVQEALVSGK